MSSSSAGDAPRAARPVVLVDVELSGRIVGPVPDDAVRRDSTEVRAFVRLHGRPIGMVAVPVPPAGLDGAALADALWAELGPVVRRHCVEDGLDPPSELSETGLPRPGEAPCSWRSVLGAVRPSATIVITTCGGGGVLATVGDALAQTYPSFEVVVVDNRPLTSGVEVSLRERFPGENRVRYVGEERAGLSHARNRGAEVAEGDIVAFTDDDVVLDPDWLAWLVTGFTDPEVGCVTGLIIPLELESDPQRWLEEFSGYGKGFERQIWDHGEHRPDHPLFPYLLGAYGSGANNAFRREALEALDGFDPALGTGTAARGGEDLDIFIRAIQQGQRLVYEPGAVVRHAHDRDTRVHRKVFDYGVGLGAMLTKHFFIDPSNAAAMLARVPRGAVRFLGARAPSNTSRSSDYPKALNLVELAGLLYAPVAYARSAAHERRRRSIAALPPSTRIWIGEVELSRSLAATGVSRPVHPSDSRARLLVRLHHQVLGFVSIPLSGDGVSPDAVGEAVRDQLAEPLRRHLEGDGSSVDSERELVSVVVCTRDRPVILGTCLKLLQQLRYEDVEVIVVDNAPSSEETRECFVTLVGNDPRFRYVREPVPGLSRARNRGLREARARYVAFTDDDVKVDPWWLDGIMAGFARDPLAGCVTGLVPPAELDEPAQQYFDRRYSWASHLEPRVFDLTDRRDDSPLYPYAVGIFGTGANFAVDRALFTALGGFDEALGAGSPAGGGEDLDAFVRVLRAGRSLVFEPSAVVWHVHRADARALERQLFQYGVGLSAFVAKYVLDPRTVGEIMCRIPSGVQRAGRLWSHAEIGDPAPKRLVLAEVAGMVSGPVAYLRGRRRLRRLEGITPPT